MGRKETEGGVGERIPGGLFACVYLSCGLSVHIYIFPLWFPINGKPKEGYLGKGDGWVIQPGLLVLFVSPWGVVLVFLTSIAFTYILADKGEKRLAFGKRMDGWAGGLRTRIFALPLCSWSFF